MPLGRFDEFSGAGAGIPNTPLDNEPTPNLQSKKESPNITVGPNAQSPANFNLNSNESENTNSASVVYPAGTNPGRPGGESGERGPRKKPNVLKGFASYSVIITIAALTKQELADPDNSYRASNPQNVILRSGGSQNQQVKTSYEREAGITLEYYIDNLDIETIMAPTPLTMQTNATTFRFQVIEPYSMGIFLETLANSVDIDQLDTNSKPNYATQPYVMILDFVGYDNEGREISADSGAQIRRYIPLRFTEIEFNVSGGGSVYDIQAIAYNDYALADEIQSIPQDAHIIGSTVAEALQTGFQSLTKMLNDRELNEKEKGNKSAANAYIIMFPNEQSSADDPYKGTIEDPRGATSVPPQIGATIRAVAENGFNEERLKDFAELSENINEIGKSKLSDEVFDGSAKPHRSTADVDNPDISLVSQAFNSINIHQGQRIQDIIEELFLNSIYGQEFATKTPDSRGMLPYFRIETEVYEIVNPANEKLRGSSAKIFVYRVLTYKVHAAHLAGSSQKPPGLPALKSSIPKEYNYLYTGQNDDILDFDLQFNTAFFQTLQFDYFQAGQDQTTGAAFSRSPIANVTPGINEGDRGDPENEPQVETQSTIQAGTNSAIISGTQRESAATRISRAFNDAIVNGIDLITAEMEIWGDPYYLNDSGMGNFRSPRVGNQQTANGAIDYQYEEAFIILNFRTPLDINSDTGGYRFPEVGGEPVRKFSGVYRVTEITNSISANKFTQRLKMIRLRNQYGEETAGSTNIKEDGQELFAELLRQNEAAEDLVSPIPEGTVEVGPIEVVNPPEEIQNPVTGEGTIPPSGSTFISP